MGVIPAGQAGRAGIEGAGPIVPNDPYFEAMKAEWADKGFVVAPLDALERLEVDRAHDLGRDEAMPVLRWSRIERPRVVLASALAFKGDQIADGLGHPSGGQVLHGASRDGHAVGILLREHSWSKRLTPHSTESCFGTSILTT